MNRSRSREIAMEVMYQMAIQNDFSKEFSRKMVAQYEEESDEAYIFEVMDAFIENRETVDSQISPLLKNWTIERVGKVDLSILRLAVTEMNFMSSIPGKVSVNEAINMSKKYVDEKSGKFINGVLKHFIQAEEK